MTAVTLPPQPRRASRLLGLAPGELIMKVASGEHQGREIRIRSPKCTIGSARGCTLRLAAKGVGPLHCWILRGPGGTIVRRRDVRTRLNGRLFSEAPLAAGDRLRIGPVELEVCQCPAVSPEWTCESAEKPEPDPVPSGAEAVRLRSELHALERKAAQQLGELNSLVGRVSTERDALTLRLRTVECEAISERDALLLDKQQLELSLSSSEQERARLQSNLSQREAEIESTIEKETRRACELEQQLQESQHEQASLRSRLAQQSESLRGECENNQSEHDRLQDECQRLEAQLTQLRELVGYTAAERDNLTVQLDGQQRNQLDQQQNLVHDREGLQERLERALAQLAEAERKLAVLKVEGDNHLHTEMQQVANLQQRLDQAEMEKSDLEGRLAQHTSTWHNERENLRQQTDRVSGHCKQVEGQLSHVRELVESLASERDSLCQQLEAAELRIAEVEQKWKEERASFEQLVHEVPDQAAAHEEMCAKLAAETASARQWQSRAEESELQLAAAGQQLAEAAERFASLRSESEGRLHDESGRAAVLAREADETRERLSATQAALADAETRLAAIRTEIEVRLNSEQERAATAERRADELTRELAAADVRLTDAEHRLAAFRTERDGSLQTESQRAAELERQLAELGPRVTALQEQLAQSEARHDAVQAELADYLAGQQTAHDSSQQLAALQQQLASSEGQVLEQTEAIAFERQSWHTDRERLHQECRMLGHRLIERQKELDDLAVRALSPAELTEINEERAAWDKQRERLVARVDELEQQLREQKQFSQGMTLGSEAIAELQAQAKAAVDAETAASATAAIDAANTSAWEAQIATLEQQLGEARLWHDRCQQAEVQCAEQREVGQRLAHQIEQLQQQLSAAAGDLPLARQEPSAEPAAAPLPSAPPASSQLAELQALYDQQQWAVSGERQSLAEERQTLVEEREFLAASQQELAKERNEFTQSQAEFEKQWRQWEDNLRGKEESLSVQAADLAVRLEQADAYMQEIERQRNDLSERKATLELEVNELASRRAAPREAGSAGDGGSSAGESRSQDQAPDPIAAQGRSPDSPESAGASALNESSVALAAGTAEQFTSPPELPAGDQGVPEHCAAQFAGGSVTKSGSIKQVWTQPDTPAPPADDDSIEAYMSRLLKRVGGASIAPGMASAAHVPAPVSSPPPAPTASSEPTADEPVNMTMVVPIIPVMPEDFRPRNKAPELTTNMAAMREVANSAARNAIAKHQRKSGGKQALVQSVGAILTLGCSGVAGYFAYTTHSIPVGIGAALGVLAAGYWSSKAARHAWKAVFWRIPASHSAAVSTEASDTAEVVPSLPLADNTKPASAEVADESAPPAPPAPQVDEQV